MQALDLLRRVGAEVAVSQTVAATATTSDDYHWCWGQGRDQVIVFPDTKCPYCQEWFVNKAIWVVSGDRMRLRGQVIPENGKPLVLSPPEHPHANSEDGDGNICFGSVPAGDAVTALFLSLNPRSAYSSVYSWVTKYGHDCLKGKDLAHCPECAALLECSPRGTDRRDAHCHGCDWNEIDDGG